MINLLLIADKSPQSLKRYADDDEMIKSCDCVIELIDSSYFLVHVHSDEIAGRLKIRFGEKMIQL